MDTNYFKAKLEEELKLVQGELEKMGFAKSENGTTDWEVKKPEDMDIDEANESEVADKFEEMRDNEAMIDQLEAKFNDIKAALKRIEDGTYGICKVSGEPIEADRLEANPAADTCKAHM